MKNGENKTNILIVDDHPLIKQGLTSVLEREDDFVVAGYAKNSAEAMQAVKFLKPDMVILDISLDGENGLELIKDMKIRHGDVNIIVLSMHDEGLYAERALRAGAKGYVMKHEAAENLIDAIRRVLSGEVYTSERMAAKMVKRFIGGRQDEDGSPLDRLSDRELEVFQLIGQGNGTRQIAEKLYLSVKTIETYRAHIKEKLDLTDAPELLRYAIEWAKK